jgi:pimeloyl-ACP methyl ester carboxylesterase
VAGCDVPGLELGECGDRPGRRFRADAETIAAGITGARLVLFEMSGHSPHLEEPEKFQNVVTEFLAEVDPHAE